MMLCSADFQSGVHAAEDRTFIITIWDLRLDLDLKNDFFAPKVYRAFGAASQACVTLGTQRGIHSLKYSESLFSFAFVFS